MRLLSSILLFLFTIFIVNAQECPDAPEFTMVTRTAFAKINSLITINMNADLSNTYDVKIGGKDCAFDNYDPVEQLYNCNVLGEDLFGYQDVSVVIQAKDECPEVESISEKAFYFHLPALLADSALPTQVSYKYESIVRFATRDLYDTEFTYKLNNKAVSIVFNYENNYYFRLPALDEIPTEESPAIFRVYSEDTLLGEQVLPLVFNDDETDAMDIFSLAPNFSILNAPEVENPIYLTVYGRGFTEVTEMYYKNNDDLIPCEDVKLISGNEMRCQLYKCTLRENCGDIFSINLKLGEEIDSMILPYYDDISTEEVKPYRDLPEGYVGYFTLEYEGTVHISYDVKLFGYIIVENSVRTRYGANLERTGLFTFSFNTLELGTDLYDDKDYDLEITDEWGNIIYSKNNIIHIIDDPHKPVVTYITSNIVEYGSTTKMSVAMYGLDQYLVQNIVFKNFYDNGQDLSIPINRIPFGPGKTHPVMCSFTLDVKSSIAGNKVHVGPKEVYAIGETGTSYKLDINFEVTLLKSVGKDIDILFKNPMTEQFFSTLKNKVADDYSDVIDRIKHTIIDSKQVVIRIEPRPVGDDNDYRLAADIADRFLTDLNNPESVLYADLPELSNYDSSKTLDVQQCPNLEFLYNCNEPPVPPVEPSNPKKKKPNNTGLIVGIVISLLVAAAVGGYIFYYKRKQKLQASNPALLGETNEDSINSYNSL